ncbi:MAG: hypothetical protein ACRDF7_00115 [Candidatus Limnocylindrales bacterium]
MRTLLAAAVCLVAVACTGPVPSPSLPSALDHYAVQGLNLDYPASWAINAAGWPSTGPGSTWAVLGTLPWGDCARSDLNCHYQVRLEAGQIQVEVGMVGMMSVDLCNFGAQRPDLAGRGPADPVATGSLTRVAGRPTVRTDYAFGGAGYYQADEERVWLIAFPGTLSSAYSIDAMYRGPGLDDLRGEVDRLIASIRIDATETNLVTGASTDCPAPFPSPPASGAGNLDPTGILLVGADEQVQARPTSDALSSAFDQALRFAEANSGDIGYPWINPSTDELVLSAATEQGRSLLVALAASITVPHRTRDVAHTYGELQRIQDAVTYLSAEGVTDAQLIYRTGPDQRDDRTLVTIMRTSRPLLDELAKRFGADAIAVQVIPTQP